MSPISNFHEALFWEIRDELSLVIPEYRDECGPGGKFEQVEGAIAMAQSETLRSRQRSLAHVEGLLSASQSKVASLKIERERLITRLHRAIGKSALENQAVTPAMQEIERLKNERDAALRRVWAMSGPNDEPNVDDPINGEMLPSREGKKKRK